MQTAVFLLNVLLIAGFYEKYAHGIALCPPGLPQVYCFVDPCQGKTCPLYPTATCRSDYCGGCFDRWYLPSGLQVRCQRPTLCPTGVPYYQCLVNPCRFAKCPKYPNAVCKPDYCGGCKARWYSSTGAELDCSVDSKCPDGVSEVACLIDPCQTATCPADPTATCTADYCGGCNTIWKKPDGTVAVCDAPTA